MKRTALLASLIILLSLFNCREATAPPPVKPAGSQKIPGSVSAQRRTPTVVVVHEMLPSVVNIQVEATIRRREFDPWFGFPQDRTYTTQAVGSGFVWASDGVIVTNAHVIEGASRIVVVFHDRTQTPARVIGVDPDNDLAVLKVNGNSLPAAPIGTSSDLLIGEPVIAIGNPFGLSGTVTRGVISATGRSVPSQEQGRTYTDFIQTDASINPGNSGGPLVNIEGKVIGINTAIYAQAQGIGFAIPVDRARKVIEDLRRYGKVQPSWLGVVTTTLTPEEASRLGFSVDRGALVSRIFDGSPASRAGIKPGDVIVGIQNAPVDSREDFSTLMASATQGQQILLRVNRDDQVRDIQVTPASPPENLGLRILGEVAGVEVQQGQRGLIITEVSPRSRGARVGLRPGDEIVGVNGREVSSLPDLNGEVVKESDRPSIVLSVARGRFIYTLTFPMGS